MDKSAAPPAIDTAAYIRQAGFALSDIKARDGQDINPNTITKAVRARALRGLRLLEDFVRRLLILLALQFEHQITVDVSLRPRPKKHRDKTKRILPAGGSALRIFPSDLALPDAVKAKYADAPPREPDGRIMLPAGALLKRFERLSAILNDPEARAHRLAFVLARHRHGALFAPGPFRMPSRFGTLVSSYYDALNHAIRGACQMRPPPQRPRPPPPPRAVFI